MSKLDKSKRKALLGVAGVSVFAAWHKPVINSVLLPAHAQTTTDTTDDTPPPPPAPMNFFAGSAQIVVQAGDAPWTPLDMFVGPAHAVAAVGPVEVQITPDASISGAYNVIVQTSYLTQSVVLDALEPVFESRFEGTVLLDGPSADLLLTSNCTSPFNEPVKLADLDEAGGTIQLSFRGATYLVPEGSGTLSEVVCHSPQE